MAAAPTSARRKGSRQARSSGMPSFLSHEELNGLKHYQYKSGGYTVLDDLHNPVWNWAVEQLPMWLAPNLITLIASGCVAAAYALNTLYLPDFTGEAPGWVYLLTALSVVAYVNLDCMDGKQARRTGSSSPLGQLFDHGCDALVLHMMLGNIAASLGISVSLKMAFGCMGILFPWILAQWEEYHTGVMMYGTRLYGVLEANYSICIVHLASWALGPKVWAVTLPMPFVGGVTLADASLLVVGMAGMAQAVHNVARVMHPGAASLPAHEAGNKQLGRPAAMRHLLGLLAVLVLGALLLHQADGCDALYARLAFSVFGFLYALMATRLIISHMCKEPLPLPWLPILLLVAAVSGGMLRGTAVPLPSFLAAWAPDAGDVAMVLVATAVVGCYSVYILSIIEQICGFLGIRVLTITPRPPRK
uniref:CDP-alcohol phosphatidyltransferase n=1 Tax=Chlamydomonas euryale TaxID=1486919 RepID=A0A7R9VBS8_9CHLO|mmetsp:Transcript_30933/g.92044  ORF Transcript_30933/g.92044 Transcript_30933/m.92044 type:complete len:418 (+) Transcript_30933:483-1736(+)